MASRLRRLGAELTTRASRVEDGTSLRALVQSERKLFDEYMTQAKLRRPTGVQELVPRTCSREKTGLLGIAVTTGIGLELEKRGAVHAGWERWGEISEETGIRLPEKSPNGLSTNQIFKLARVEYMHKAKLIDSEFISWVNQDATNPQRELVENYDRLMQIQPWNELCDRVLLVKPDLTKGSLRAGSDLLFKDSTFCEIKVGKTWQSAWRAQVRKMLGCAALGSLRSEACVPKHVALLNAPGGQILTWPIEEFMN